MQSVISNSLIATINPRPEPYEIRDTRLKGFLLRVQPSGVMTYYIEFGRARRMALGRANAIAPAMAREKAKSILADVYKGNDPTTARRNGLAHTLQSYIDEVYAAWARANIRTADATVARLKASFYELLGKRLGELTAWQVEKWRASRLKGGVKATTANRDLDDLRSALTKAVTWGLLEVNPVSAVKRSRIDNSASVRFLGDDEETRLRKTLEEREFQIKQARDNANQWRDERGYAILPDLSTQTFADRLRPMVLLSLNTGLRRGELFGVAWEDVDLERANLTIHGANAKSGRTRHIPLNKEALESFRCWKHDTSGSTGLVFPGKRGMLLNNTRRAWLAVLERANITRFRWHDLRHTFASRLVTMGVDLNTVRELLGHSDYKMTLRYAHLAPEHKAAAVAKLMNKGATVVEDDSTIAPLHPSATAN